MPYLGLMEAVLQGGCQKHNTVSTYPPSPPARLYPSGVHMLAAGPRRFLPSGGRGGGAPVKMGKEPQGAERGLKGECKGGEGELDACLGVHVHVRRHAVCGSVCAWALRETQLQGAPQWRILCMVGL
jgi:hypothetical protein